MCLELSLAFFKLRLIYEINVKPLMCNSSLKQNMSFVISAVPADDANASADTVTIRAWSVMCRGMVPEVFSSVV